MIPTFIFKKEAPLIIDEVTAIVNISSCDSVFANQWKNAFVCPLLKTVGLDLILKKYRLVSNLLFYGNWSRSAYLCQSTYLLTGLITAVSQHCLNWPVTFSMQWSIKKQWHCLYFTSVQLLIPWTMVSCLTSSITDLV